MPRRSNKNGDLWEWVIVAFVVIVAFALIKKFIEENAWVRWILFTVFTTTFIICIRSVFNGMRNRIVNLQWLCALVGAFFSFLIIDGQTDFFVLWWTPGVWLVRIFYVVIGIWLLVLVIQLIMEWWQGRRQGYL